VKPISSVLGDQANLYLLRESLFN